MRSCQSIIIQLMTIPTTSFRNSDTISSKIRPLSSINCSRMLLMAVTFTKSCVITSKIRPNIYLEMAYSLDLTKHPLISFVQSSNGIQIALLFDEPLHSQWCFLQTSRMNNDLVDKKSITFNHSKSVRILMVSSSSFFFIQRSFIAN